MHASESRQQEPGGGALYRRRHRLPGSAYAPVFDARLRKSRGPVTVHLRPNGLGEHRLGLSIGRRFGGAVRRNRFKRMMREVFRLQRGRLPTPGDGGAYDIVVTARSHEDAPMDRYVEWFMDAVQAAHRVHEKRRAGKPGDPGGEGGDG